MDSNTAKASFVTNIHGCTQVDTNKVKAFLESVPLPPTCQEITEEVVVREVYSILDYIPNGPSVQDSVDYGTHKRVILACRNAGLAKEHALAWSKQSRKHCDSAFDKLWKQKPRVSGFNLGDLENISKRFYPRLIVEPQFDSLCRPSKEMLQNPAIRVKRYQGAPHCKPIDFSKEIKHIALRADMGTGKTTVLERLLREKPPNSVLVITPRVTLSYDLWRRLQAALPEIKLYTDNPDFSEARYLVCQLDSLWKIQLDYDVLILDECESILKHFGSPTIIRFTEVVHKFECAIQNAQHVFWMDAFLQDRTLQTCLHLGGNDKGILYIENTAKPHANRHAYELKSQEMVRKLEQLLKSSHNVAFASGSKSKLDRLQASEVFKDLPQKPLFIHAFSDDKVKESIRDGVHSWWKQFSFVGWSPTITVGVNFDEPHFHDMFVYATRQSANPRDMIQSHLRVRHLRNDAVYFCVDLRRSPRGLPLFTVQQCRVLADECEEYRNELCSSWIGTSLWLKDIFSYNQVEDNISAYYYEDVLIHFFNQLGYTVHLGLHGGVEVEISLPAKAHPDYNSIKAVDHANAIFSHRASEHEKLEHLKFRYIYEVLNSRATEEQRAASWEHYCSNQKEVYTI